MILPLFLGYEEQSKMRNCCATHQNNFFKIAQKLNK